MTRAAVLLLLGTGCDTSPTGDDNNTVDLDADGFVAGEDCDDSDPLTYPGADEICDGLDNSCDGAIDSGVTLTVYVDTDGDGFGLGSTAASSCELAPGFAAVGGDCDDQDPDIHPDADEYCNGLDDDCDGTADDSPLDMLEHFADGDGDGVGDDATVAYGCTLPLGRVRDGGDCDDADAGVYPGAFEQCNGIDDDCDAATVEDETVTFLPRTGRPVDLTEIMASGNRNFPARYLVKEPGEMVFCGGRWFAAIEARADLVISGVGGAAENTLNANEIYPTLKVVTRDGDPQMSQVRVSGMTLLNGKANEIGLDDGRRSGGGVFCDNGADILLEDVTIRGAEAEVGGGIYTQGCALELQSVTVEANQAVFGAGIAIDGGDAEAYGSVIRDNASGLYGGGVYLYASRDDARFSMVDSWLTDNTAQFYGAAAYLMPPWGSSRAAHFSCEATSSGAGGVLGNSDLYTWYSYGAVYLYGYSSTSSSIASAGCDFGEAGRADDNTPVDVGVQSTWPAATYSYGDDAWFTCNRSSCW